MPILHNLFQKTNLKYLIKNYTFAFQNYKYEFRRNNKCSW